MQQTPDTEKVSELALQKIQQLLSVEVDEEHFPAMLLAYLVVAHVLGYKVADILTLSEQIAVKLSAALEDASNDSE
jgi:hypothetical protein